MNTKIVSKELIKPCTPTPQNLKNYKLSFIDELSPRLEVGVLLFYTSSKNRSALKESLASVLVRFYPLAGRYIPKYRTIDCSDQGAEFVEAEAAGVGLNDVIGENNLAKLGRFVPFKDHQVDEAIDPILSVQVTDLKCGGVVIGISVSHRVFDASSLGTFIAAWSQESNAITVGESIVPINPNFDSRMLFPSRNPQIGDVEQSVPTPPKPIVKRFSFSKEAITSLRSNLTPNEGKKGISRVQVVSSVLAKALFGVDRASNGGKLRPSFSIQAVNMRGRTIPPLPKHACGNLVILSCMAVAKADSGLQELVSLSVNVIDNTVSECAKLLAVGEEELIDIGIKRVANAFMKSMSGEANLLWFIDWTKFGFYEADFGWGKPVWASIVPMPNPKTIILMNDKEGSGIEAWVHLDEIDMPLFEEDEEIRSLTAK